MLKKLHFLYLLLPFLVIQKLYAQPNLFAYDIRSFSKANYKAGAQNWKICQDNFGRIYCANSEGLLQYNGTTWNLYNLPNKTIVRSLLLGANNKIYAGGQDEFGVFEPNSSGILKFKSFTNLLPAGIDVADVWNIAGKGNEVFFQSNNLIICVRNNIATLYNPQSSWLFLGDVGGQIVAHDEKSGLLLYKNGNWVSWIPKDNLPAGFFITSTHNVNDSLSIIATANNGLWQVKNNSLLPFELETTKPIQITGITSLYKNHILLSTANDGILLIDKSGKIQQHLLQSSGLPGNHVLTIFTDRDQNIWAGFQNGLGYIASNSAIKHIKPPLFNHGAGYSAIQYGPYMYFALSTGIFSIPKNDLLIDNINHNQAFSTIYTGPAWRLSEVYGKLYSLQDNGLYAIENNRLTWISGESGYWNIKPLSNGRLMAGTYYGLNVFKTSPPIFSNLQYQQTIGSSRFIEADSNGIWMSHPYRGVYHINDQKQQASLLGTRNGLPSNINNHVYQLGSKLVFATEKGIYNYNASSNSFSPDKQFDPFFKSKGVRYVYEDSAQNIWYVQQKTPGVLIRQGQGYKQITFPELSGNILSGFENMFPISKEQMIIGGEDGFYIINLQEYVKNNRVSQAFIQLVSLTGIADSVLYGGFKQSGSLSQSLPYNLNSFHIEFFGNNFQISDATEFSFILEGFDNSWSEWTKLHYKDYTGLPPGKYSFKVKARNNFFQESAPDVFSFTIQPRWYQTMLARILFFLLGMAAIWWLYKMFLRRQRYKQNLIIREEKRLMLEQQRKLDYQHQIALQKSERERERLINENLKADIERKNDELSKAAINLVQKREYMGRMRDELKHILKTSDEKIDKSMLKKLSRMMGEDQQFLEEWDQFYLMVNNTNADFLHQLQERFPELTQGELRLCAYLRMNLSSKEIAHLMGISLRGVENSRYRLRKKLQLDSDINLTRFIFDFQR